LKNTFFTFKDEGTGSNPLNTPVGVEEDVSS